MNADAYPVAQLLRTRVWMYHGYPEEIVSDRDPRFVSKFMKALHELTGCRPALSTAFQPQTDGQTERTNRILGDYLKHYVADHGRDWDSYLPEAEFAYNNSWQTSINTTPFRLTYGQDPNVPFANGHLGKTRVGSADEFVRKMGLDIRRAQKFLAAAQDRQTAYANRRRSDASFVPGDYVLVDRDFFAVHRKLPQKFAPRRVGPFKVLSSPGPNAYRLEFPDGYDRYHPTVNVNFLTPYRTADDARLRPPPPPPHLVNDHIEYEIGGIVDHKPLMDDRGRTLYDPDGTPHMQYLVRWKGYTPDHDTWEPLTNFTRCRQQVEQYRGSHGLPPLPPRGTIPRIRP
jgi:hypothetical protein